MWAEDIAGSEAYAKALQKTGIITDKETKEICEGLQKVRAEWAAGEFKVVVSLILMGLALVWLFCSFSESSILRRSRLFRLVLARATIPRTAIELELPWLNVHTPRSTQIQGTYAPCEDNLSIFLAGFRALGPSFEATGKIWN